MASCIIDPNTGRPYQGYGNRRPARSANLGGGERPSESRNLRDLHQIVTKYDRQTLVSASKTLYLNSQILIGAIDQKAMYSVGNAWLPVYKGRDKAFGDAAKDWLAGEWYEISNLSGTSDFVEDLYIASVAIDRDGEVFEYSTATPNGYPQIQIIPSHRIDAGGLPEGELKTGKYAGKLFYHEDGIVYSADNSRPVAYSFCDENTKHLKFIEAHLIKHEFEKLWPEQKRGLPIFYHSLNGLRDILQSEEWERLNLLSMSSLNYTVHNETGGPDTEEPDYQGPACGEFAVQYAEGGRVMYARAGAGEKIEQHQNMRPGNPWMEFQDMQVRLALGGINWPYSLWKPSGQGTAERHEIGKACRSVEDRQAKLRKIAKWRITKALAWGMANGRIPKSADWFNWGFSTPAKLTIDDGRTSKEKIEQYRIGAINLTDLIGELGGNFDEFLEKRGEEVMKRITKRKEIEAALGEDVDPREFQLLTPNEPAPKEEAAPTTQEP